MVAGTISEACIGEDVDMVATQLVGPAMTAGAVHGVLDGHERTVRVEPTLILTGELEELSAGKTPFRLEALEGAFEFGGRLLQQIGVAREGGRSGVGGAEGVGGIDRQDLPVAQAGGSEVIDKAASGRTEGARTTCVGK